jgi:SNF2 family DNA or RNA helicase
MKKLHNYQLQAIDFIKSNKRCGLFIEMGLGKTISTLTTIDDLIKSKQIKSAMVVAPLRVASNTWGNEVKQWEHTSHLNISKCLGKAKDRVSACMTPHDILVINYDNIKWYVDNVNNHYDMLVLDESSMVKNYKTKRFNAIKKLAAFAKYVVLLTGTPSPNSIRDLWSQLYLIDNGDRLGKFVTKFINNYFYRSTYNLNILIQKKDAADIVLEKIKDVCMSMKAEDYISLPDRIDLIEYADLSEQDMLLYTELENEFIIELNNQDIVTPNIMSLSQKLMQICNGFIYNDNEVIYVHNNKIEMLKEIVADNPNENILVFYQFKEDLNRLKQQFKDAKELTYENLELWDKGKIPMLLANPKSAGHGLNLQAGGSIIVWYSLNYSLEQYLQANARLYRQGQLKAVRILHLITKGTIEQKMYDVLTDKNRNQTKIIDYLRYVYKNEHK